MGLTCEVNLIALIIGNDIDRRSIHYLIIDRSMDKVVWIIMSG